MLLILRIIIIGFACQFIAQLVVQLTFHCLSTTHDNHLDLVCDYLLSKPGYSIMYDIIISSCNACMQGSVFI